MIRKSQQGIWGERQRALSNIIWLKKNGTRPLPPKKANKNCGETKGGLSQLLLHSSLCTVHSVLTLGIVCKLIALVTTTCWRKKVVTNATNSNTGISWIPWSSYYSLPYLFDIVKPTVPLMCFASCFLRCILVFLILEGIGEKYPNIESGQFQLKFEQLLYIFYRETSYEKRHFPLRFASAESLRSDTTLCSTS